MNRPSSPSEYKINELYPNDWKHDPNYWKQKGLKFEEDKEAGQKLAELANARGNCKNITV